jgi:hypothetical protein
VLTPSPAFLQIEGTANEAIIVDGGDLSRAAKPLAMKGGATAKAVTMRGVASAAASASAAPAKRADK